MSLVERIRAAGVELKAAGDRLFVRGTVTAAQRDWLSTHRADVVAELRTTRRPIVEFRIKDDSVWYVMLGRADESFNEAAAACRRQFSDVVALRERESLPEGFPFRRRDEEGEWKRQDGSDL